MAKRKKLIPDIPVKDDISNPFIQYGEQIISEHGDWLNRLIQFSEPSASDETGFAVDPYINSWLDALDAADDGDKSALVALMKSGRPLPGVIIPHIGDLIDRWNLVRPKHKMRLPSHRWTEEDVAMNGACCDVDDLVSAGKSIDDALIEVANERELKMKTLSEYVAKRRGPDRRVKERTRDAKRRAGRRVAGK
jgi:hypothetical protein